MLNVCYADKQFQPIKQELDTSLQSEMDLCADSIGWDVASTDWQEAFVSSHVRSGRTGDLLMCLLTGGMWHGCAGSRLQRWTKDSMSNMDEALKEKRSDEKRESS